MWWGYAGERPLLRRAILCLSVSRGCRHGCGAIAYGVCARATTTPMPTTLELARVREATLVTKAALPLEVEATPSSRP
jgi:hypothetical protein